MRIIYADNNINAENESAQKPLSFDLCIAHTIHAWDEKLGLFWTCTYKHTGPTNGCLPAERLLNLNQRSFYVSAVVVRFNLCNVSIAQAAAAPRESLTRVCLLACVCDVINLTNIHLYRFNFKEGSVKLQTCESLTQAHRTLFCDSSADFVKNHHLIYTHAQCASHTQSPRASHSLWEISVLYARARACWVLLCEAKR